MCSDENAIFKIVRLMEIILGMGMDYFKNCHLGLGLESKSTTRIRAFLS